MKHRERVLLALERQTPDRCPMQISFTPEFARRLRDEMHRAGQLDASAQPDVASNTVGNALRGVPRITMESDAPPRGTPRRAFPAVDTAISSGSASTHNPHGGGNTYELERALDEDMLLTSVGWANSYYQGSQPYTDEWGVGWRPCMYETPFGQGIYTEVASHPLADDKAIDAYRAPDPNRPELYGEAQKLLAEHKKEYFIVGVTVTTIFETAWALRGLSQLMVDFVADPDLAHRILDIPYQYHLAAAKRLVAMGVDMIWTGDDVGTQNGMMISPAHWRTFLKPRMARFFAELKAINAQVKLAYHCDGDLRTIIPELIEIGVDVLNPIQPACMDPAEIRRRYGDRLCFWGSLDEQHTLPFGTPDDVRREVLSRLGTIGHGGGLVIGPTHHVQLDTPMENFWAMVDAIRNTPYASLP